MEQTMYSMADAPTFNYMYSERAAAMIEPHSHNSYELLFILQGRGFVCIEDRRYAIAPYDLIITRPALHHYLEFDTSLPYERYNSLIVPEHALARIAAHVSEKREVLHCTAHPMIIENFIRLGRYQKDCEEAVFSDLCNALLCEVLYNAQMADGSLLSSPEQKSPVVERALEYINENLFTIGDVEEVASALFLAKNYFFRVFKNAMKISPKKYITSKRLLAAQQLLRRGERATSVYLRCGFSTYPSFYKRYVEFFGYAPSEERERSAIPERYTE